MGYREELQRRIDQQQQKVWQLQADARDANTYLQGLVDAMKLLPKEPNPNKEIRLRDGSAIAEARKAILAQKRPMHISEIMPAIGGKESDQPSVSSGISAYVRKGEIFVRTAPNTFGLIELGHHNPPEELVAAKQNHGEAIAIEDES
jgi:hypothetical protein